MQVLHDELAAGLQVRNEWDAVADGLRADTAFAVSVYCIGQQHLHSKQGWFWRVIPSAMEPDQISHAAMCQPALARGADNCTSFQRHGQQPVKLMPALAERNLILSTAGRAAYLEVAEGELHAGTSRHCDQVQYRVRRTAQCHDQDLPGSCMPLEQEVTPQDETPVFCPIRTVAMFAQACGETRAP